MDPRRGHRQRQVLLRDLDQEPTSVQFVVTRTVPIGIIPYCPDFHRRLILGDLGRLATLFLNVRFYDLGGDTGGKGGIDLQRFIRRSAVPG